MTFARSVSDLGNITAYLIFIVSVVSLGPLQFGFHLAELNAPQQAITCSNDISNSFSLSLSMCIPMSEIEFTFVSSIFTLGGFLGAISGGPPSSKKGRVLTMRLATIASILGSSLEALAPNLQILAVGRVLSGLGAGLSLVVVPLYISEVAPPDSKGLFGATTQIAVNLGILITLVLGYFCGNGAEWRIILGVAGIIALLRGFALCFVPESPAWLALNNNTEKAIDTLRRMRGRGIDIQAELISLISSRESSEDDLTALLHRDDLVTYDTSPTPKTPGSKLPQVGFLEVVCNPLYRPALIAVIGIMLAQQLTGINSVMMYSVSLLAPLFPNTSTLITMFLSFINVLITIICAPLPDILGRKPTLLLSITGMGLSSLALALAMLLSLRILTGISALCFVASFGVGLGAIPFTLASELVEREASASTQSAGLAANWAATFVVAQGSPLVNAGLNGWLGGSGWLFLGFAALAGVAGCFVVVMVPETKGRESLDEVWGRE